MRPVVLDATPEVPKDVPFLVVQMIASKRLKRRVRISGLVAGERSTKPNEKVLHVRAQLTVTGLEVPVGEVVHGLMVVLRSYVEPPVCQLRLERADLRCKRGGAGGSWTEVAVLKHEPVNLQCRVEAGSVSWKRLTKGSTSSVSASFAACAGGRVATALRSAIDLESLLPAVSAVSASNSKNRVLRSAWVKALFITSARRTIVFRENGIGCHLD